MLYYVCNMYKIYTLIELSINSNYVKKIIKEVAKNFK